MQLGQWPLRSNAVERRPVVTRPRVCDALDLLLGVSACVRRLHHKHRITALIIITVIAGSDQRSETSDENSAAT